MGGMREVRAMQQRQLEFLAQFNDGPMKRPPAGEFDEVYDDYEADQAPEARMDPPHTSQDLNCVILPGSPWPSCAFFKHCSKR